MRTKTYRDYTVTITPTVAVAGQYNGPEELDQTFRATSAAEAIKQARRYMTDVAGHDPKTDGRLIYKARVEE